MELEQRTKDNHCETCNLGYNLVENSCNNYDFLRKIIEGGADRSYGVHVAEMAGLPKSVVVRAHDLLKTLSKSERSKLKASESMPIIEQMDIFTSNNDKLQFELNKLDINTMTPLDALAKLDELKKKHGV